jgi:hypothetical protein
VFNSNLAYNNFPEKANDIQYVLFLLGFQVTQNDLMNFDWTDFFSQCYFYILLFWLNVIELKCFYYLKEKFEALKLKKLEEEESAY